MTSVTRVEDCRRASPNGLGLGFPRAAALTDALLAPAQHEVPAGELRELRAMLLRELPRLAARIGPTDRLQIGAHELSVAREHPELCGAERGEFSPSPVRCRRAIGLTAVERCVRGRSPNPQVAVAEVLASEQEDHAAAADVTGASRPAWWAGWYVDLLPAARAVVQAEAVTWATQLWTALDWSRFERPPVVGGRDDWWDCPGQRRLVLRGRSEVRSWVGNRQVMFTVAPRFPGEGWRSDLAYRALVAGLSRGERSVPARVVGLWPASGLARVCEVDGEALSEAAATLTAAVGTWVGGIRR